MAAGGGDGRTLLDMLYLERLRRQLLDDELIGELTDKLSQKEEYIKELQKKLLTHEDQNHYLTARLAAISQADKADRPRLEKMVMDLTMEKNQMADTIERLEKELEKAKKSCFKF